MLVYTLLKSRLTSRLRSFVLPFSKMALTKFEYVKHYEKDDTLLQNCWIVVRIDGKAFHKFVEVHNFQKPNDWRGLHLMNRAAATVMEEYSDIVMAYGQSDEYSFILKKDTMVHNRRAYKIVTTITSLFTSSYIFHWNKYFTNENLKYPPCFDGRSVLYPSNKNLIDYMSWRQADVHINNLYNTTFWNLVLKGCLTTTEAEERLSGTLSADKNEILFSEFKINYNNEPLMFKKGSILLRKRVLDSAIDKRRTVIVDIHEDMIKDKFWETHSEVLKGTSPPPYDLNGDISELVQEQLEKKRVLSYKISNEIKQ